MNKNNCSLLIIVILLIYFLINNSFTTVEHMTSGKLKKRRKIVDKITEMRQKANMKNDMINAGLNPGQMRKAKLSRSLLNARIHRARIRKANINKRLREDINNIDEIGTGPNKQDTGPIQLGTGYPIQLGTGYPIQLGTGYPIQLGTGDPYIHASTDSSQDLMLTSKQKLYGKKTHGSYNDIITGYKGMQNSRSKKKVNLDNWMSEMAEKGVSVSTDYTYSSSGTPRPFQDEVSQNTPEFSNYDTIHEEVTPTPDHHETPTSDYHETQGSDDNETHGSDDNETHGSDDNETHGSDDNETPPPDYHETHGSDDNEEVTSDHVLYDMPVDYSDHSSSTAIPAKYTHYSTTHKDSYNTKNPSYKDYLTKLPSMHKYDVQIFPKTTDNPFLIDEYSDDMSMTSKPFPASYTNSNDISDTLPSTSDTSQNDEVIYYENGGKNIIVDPKSGKKFIETSEDPRQLIQSLDDDNIIKKSYDSNGNEINEIFDKDGNKIAMYSPDTGRVYKAVSSEKLSREVVEKLNKPLPYQEDYPQVTIKPDKTYDKMKNDYGQMKDDYSKLKEELDQYKIKDSIETPFPKERIQWSDKYKQQGTALDEVGKPVIDPLQTSNCVNNVTLNILSDSKRIRRLRQYNKYKNNKKRDKDFTAKINKNVLKREIENDIENEIKKNSSNKINGKRRSRKKNRWNRHLDTNQALLSNYYVMKQKKC
jgi:hypothetical protein